MPHRTTPGRGDRAHMQYLYETVWLGEVWSQGNVQAVDQVLAPDFCDHRPIPQFAGDRAGHKQMAADWHSAFPDMVFIVEDVIVDGDKLVGRYNAQGSHLGTLVGIPATGARVTLTGLDCFRFRGHEVTDWWHNEDMQGVLDQIEQARSTATHLTGGDSASPSPALAGRRGDEVPGAKMLPLRVSREDVQSSLEIQ